MGLRDINNNEFQVRMGEKDVVWEEMECPECGEMMLRRSDEDWECINCNEEE